MIIWNFKGIETKFRSTPAKHDRDIFKMARACGISPETEIIYHNGNPNRNTIKNIFAVSSDPATEEQPTVQKNAKARKAKPKATPRLPDLPGDVDKSTDVPNPVEGDSRSSDSSSSGDSIPNGGDGQDTQ